MRNQKHKKKTKPKNISPSSAADNKHLFWTEFVVDELLGGEEPLWIRWVTKKKGDKAQARLVVVGKYRVFSLKKTLTGKKKIVRVGHLFDLKEIISHDIDKVWDWIYFKSTNEQWKILGRSSIHNFQPRHWSIRCWHWFHLYHQNSNLTNSLGLEWCCNSKSHFNSSRKAKKKNSSSAKFSLTHLSKPEPYPHFHLLIPDLGMVFCKLITPFAIISSIVHPKNLSNLSKNSLTKVTWLFSWKKSL